MTKITNITQGPKGLHDKHGALVMLEGGETADIELGAGDLNKEWFGTGEVESVNEPGPLDGSIEDLTAHLATVTDADAVQALIDAETAGKSRKGAIEALEARRDELLAA